MNSDELKDLAAALRYAAERCNKAASKLELHGPPFSLKHVDEINDVADAVCILIKSGKTGPFREWTEKLQALVLQKLVIEHGYNGRKIGDVLGANYNAARRYAQRHGVKFKKT